MIDDPLQTRTASLLAGAAPAPQRGTTAPTRIELVGTPLGDWGPLAAALRAAAAELGLSTGAAPLVPAPGNEAVLRDLARQPGTLVVGLVEHPERVLARTMTTAGVPAAAGAADGWAAGARLLLLLAQAAPYRVVLLDVEDALASPQGIASTLQRWSGSAAAPGPVAVAAAPAVDPVRRLAARTLLASGKPAAARRLYDELLATCQRLSETRAPSLGELVGAALQPARKAEAALADAQRRIAAAVRTQQDIAGEADLLVAQLHDAQLDAETQELRAAALQRELGRVLPDALPPVRAGSLQVVQVHDAGEHRHVQVAIAAVEHAHRAFPVLEVRLVEHLKRPGLLVFSTGAPDQALSAWQADGQENGRDFMLLFPSDAASAERLLRLGTLDWTMVLALVRLLKHDLAASAAVPARWGAVAGRLLRQLEDLPERLRYDHLAVAPASDGASELVLGQALHGTRALGDVRLRLDPRRPALHWHAPDDPALVPLADWPVSADGTLQPQRTLPLGQGLPPAEARRAWLQATPSVRALYLRLLDPLIGSDAVPADVRQAARSMRRQALGLLWRVRLQGAARRLLRRLVRR